MARFNYSEANNYGGTGGSGFFSLKDDGDKATVRLLYNDEQDVECFSVHEVEVNGKKRYVNCLREYDQPIDNCPFCREGMFTSVKLIVPIYDERDDQVKIWERGKSFIPTITGLCSMYAEEDTIVSQKFTIVRSGKAGSKDTRYNIFPTKDAPDGTTLEDFDEPNIVGPKGFVLEKTFDEMEFYLDAKHFPSEEEDEPVRRGGRDNEEERTASRRSSGSRRTGRRTPSDTF